jgi:hypothetical protein
VRAGWQLRHLVLVDSALKDGNKKTAMLLRLPLPATRRGSQPQLLATAGRRPDLLAYLVSILQELIVPLLRPGASLLLCALGLHQRPV